MDVYATLRKPKGEGGVEEIPPCTGYQITAYCCDCVYFHGLLITPSNKLGLCGYAPTKLRIPGLCMYL